MSFLHMINEAEDEDSLVFSPGIVHMSVFLDADSGKASVEYQNLTPSQLLAPAELTSPKQNSSSLGSCPMKDASTDFCTSISSQGAEAGSLLDSEPDRALPFACVEHLMYKVYCIGLPPMLPRIPEHTPVVPGKLGIDPRAYRPDKRLLPPPLDGIEEEPICESESHQELAQITPTCGGGDEPEIHLDVNPELPVPAADNRMKPSELGLSACCSPILSPQVSGQGAFPDSLSPDSSANQSSLASLVLDSSYNMSSPGSVVWEGLEPEGKEWPYEDLAALDGEGEGRFEVTAEEKNIVSRSSCRTQRPRPAVHLGKRRSRAQSPRQTWAVDAKTGHSNLSCRSKAAGSRKRLRLAFMERKASRPKTAQMAKSLANIDETGPLEFISTEGGATSSASLLLSEKEEQVAFSTSPRFHQPVRRYASWTSATGHYRDAVEQASSTRLSFHAPASPLATEFPMETSQTSWSPTAVSVEAVPRPPLGHIGRSASVTNCSLPRERQGTKPQELTSFIETPLGVRCPSQEQRGLRRCVSMVPYPPGSLWSRGPQGSMSSSPGPGGGHVAGRGEQLVLFMTPVREDVQLRAWAGTTWGVPEGAPLPVSRKFPVAGVHTSSPQMVPRHRPWRSMSETGRMMHSEELEVQMNGSTVRGVQVGQKEDRQSQREKWATMRQMRCSVSHTASSKEIDQLRQVLKVVIGVETDNLTVVDVESTVPSQKHGVEGGGNFLGKIMGARGLPGRSITVATPGAQHGQLDRQQVHQRTRDARRAHGMAGRSVSYGAFLNSHDRSSLQLTPLGSVGSGFPFTPSVPGQAEGNAVLVVEGGSSDRDGGWSPWCLSTASSLSFTQRPRVQPWYSQVPTLEAESGNDLEDCQAAPGKWPRFLEGRAVSESGSPCRWLMGEGEREQGEETGEETGEESCGFLDARVEEAGLCHMLGWQDRVEKYLSCISPGNESEAEEEGFEDNKVSAGFSRNTEPCSWEERKVSLPVFGHKLRHANTHSAFPSLVHGLPAEEEPRDSPESWFSSQDGDRALPQKVTSFASGTMAVHEGPTSMIHAVRPCTTSGLPAQYSADALNGSPSSRGMSPAAPGGARMGAAKCATMGARKGAAVLDPRDAATPKNDSRRQFPSKTREVGAPRVFRVYTHMGPKGRLWPSFIAVIFKRNRTQEEGVEQGKGTSEGNKVHRQWSRSKTGTSSANVAEESKESGAARQEKAEKVAGGAQVQRSAKKPKTGAPQVLERATTKMEVTGEEEEMKSQDQRCLSMGHSIPCNEASESCRNSGHDLQQEGFRAAGDKKGDVKSIKSSMIGKGKRGARRLLRGLIV